MTTDLSKYDANLLPNADVLCRQRYAIVVADWNPEITFALAQGAIDTLLKHGVTQDHIQLIHVPGTVELTFAAKQLVADSHAPDAVIVIGCVIRGGTPHFDYVCQSVTQGVTMLNVQYDVPVIFSVLTCDDTQQAVDRAGGALGNKGVEGAYTAIRMANMHVYESL